MTTEVTMVLVVGTLMANFLTVGARQVSKQDLMYIFCKADFSILFKEEKKKGYAEIEIRRPCLKTVREKCGISNLITQLRNPDGRIKLFFFKSK